MDLSSWSSTNFNGNPTIFVYPLILNLSRWIHIDLHGSLRTFINLHASPYIFINVHASWILIDLCSSPWIFFHGLPWIFLHGGSFCMDIQRNSSSYIRIHESPWSPWDLHGSLSISMESIDLRRSLSVKIHDFLCIFNDLHRSPWISIHLNRLSWISMDVDGSP